MFVADAVADAEPELDVEGQLEDDMRGVAVGVAVVEPGADADKVGMENAEAEAEGVAARLVRLDGDEVGLTRDSDGEGLSDAMGVVEELLVGPNIVNALGEAEAEGDLLGDTDGTAEGDARGRSIRPAALKGASASTRGSS